MEWTRPGSIPSTLASTRNISVCPVTKGRCISSPWRIRFSTGEASKSNYFLVNYSNHSSHVFLHRTFFSTGSCVFGTTLVFTPSLESSLRTLRSQKWPKWKVGWQIQGVRLHPVPLFFIFFIFSHLWKGPIDRKYFFWLVLRSTNRRSVLKWKKPLIFRTVADCSFFLLFHFTSDPMTVDCKVNRKSISYRLALSKVEKKEKKSGTGWNRTLGPVTQLFHSGHFCDRNACTKFIREGVKSNVVRNTQLSFFHSEFYLFQIAKLSRNIRGVAVGHR